MGGHPWAGRGGAQGAQATALPTRRHARPWAVMALLVLAAWVVAGGVVAAARRHQPTALSNQIRREVCGGGRSAVLFRYFLRLV